MNAVIRPMESRYTLNSIIAHSPAMQDVVEHVRQFSMKPSPVLVHGERGTGKRLVARSIHSESPRGDQPLAVVRCDTLSVDILEKVLFGDIVTSHVGKFDEAGEGAILFARLEELNAVAQERLLRTLEEGRYVNGFQETRLVNCRLLATADKAELEKRVKLGYFSRELCQKFSVLNLRVPTLEERLDDMPHLVVTFLEDLSQREGIETPTVPYHYMELLMNVPWTGNVRQLRNHLESVMVLSHGEFTPEILLEHFERTEEAATFKGALQELWSKITGTEASPVAVTNR